MRHSRPHRWWRGRAALTSSLAAAIALAGPAAGARADETIFAVPQTQYANPSVTIDQGEPLYFHNLDLVGHDVTSLDAGPDGKSLFKTPVISTGERVPVEGAEKLGPGSYPFICSIHPYMTGSVSVTGEGVREGGREDRRAPGLKVRILDADLRAVRREGALGARVKIDERASVHLSGRMTVGDRRLKLGTADEELKPGAQVVEVELARKAKRALEDAKRAKIAVAARAEDASGNSTHSSDTKTLKR